MEAAPLLLFAAGVALVVLVGWLSWQAQKRRREEFFALAVRLGFEYAAKDPFSTTDLPFALFSRGAGRGVENVLWGPANGGPVRLFDYWYYTESTDSKGSTSRSYHRFSCALVEVDASCPHLTLDHESLGTRIADRIGFRDIEFESEEFNRAWNVKCEDRRFAFAFVDASMMAWLLDEGGAASYEVMGPLVLCSVGRLKPAELEGLLGLALRFRGRVPAVVASLYPREPRTAQA